MRRAARIDGNHAKIVQALVASGAKVQSLAALGGGCPDLLVSRGGVNYLLEVKRPELQTYAPKGWPEKKRLAEQQAWRDAWRGPVKVVYSVDQALEAIGVVV